MENQDPQIPPTPPTQPQNIPVQQQPAPSNPISTTTEPKTHSQKILLIILGILEMPFPAIALYILIPLLKLQRTIGTSFISPYLGLVFFVFALVLALIQLLAGLFSYDLKLGKQKTKGLIVSGLILAVLTIPAMILFIIMPIYGNVSSLNTSKNEAKMTPTATPTPTIDPTANWKTYTSVNGDFTMKYPATFYSSKIAVYEGGGDEIYLADSKETISKSQQNTSLSNQNILIQPIELSFGEVGDATGHTKDEILEKIANRLGTSKLVDGSVNVPWINENGGMLDGKQYYYSANFTKLTVSGTSAARVVTNDNIVYIIMRDNGYISLSASPANSIFIGDFDKMVSTLTLIK